MLLTICPREILKCLKSQLGTACSKLTIEALEQGLKYVQR